MWCGPGPPQGVVTVKESTASSCTPYVCLLSFLGMSKGLSPRDREQPRRLYGSPLTESNVPQSMNRAPSTRMAFTGLRAAMLYEG